MSKEDKVFEASPVYLVPIITSLFVGFLCSIIFLEAEVEIRPIMPENGLNSVSNAVYFVILIAFGAYLMYFLLKRKFHLGIRLILGVAVSAITFMLSLLYFDLLFTIFHLEISLWFLFALAIAAMLAVDYLIFSYEGVMHNVVILLVGGSLGAFLGVTVPTLSAVFILLLLAVYDVIAVYYGPVGKIASHGLENLPGVTFCFKDVHVGLGDLTFYSMLLSHALIFFDWKAGLFAFVGIVAGSFIAFKMLERKGMFPGLPIPIILGLSMVYLSSLF